MTPRFAAAALLLLPAALAAGSTACRAPRRSAAVPVAAATVPPDTGGATFDLAGVVRDEASGRPLPHTLVVAAAGGAGPERRTGTDSAGAYRFTGLPRGDYEVSARRVGYYVERRDLSVRCPVTVVDSAGRPLSRAGPCDPTRQTLNFLMRAHAVY